MKCKCKKKQCKCVQSFKKCKSRYNAQVETHENWAVLSLFLLTLIYIV